MNTYSQGKQQESSWFNTSSQTNYKTNIMGSMRTNFVRKVFSIVSCQLLATTLFTAITMYNAALSHYVRHTQWLMWVSLIGTIGTMLCLTLSERMARTVPTNYYLLAAFTAFESYSVACICNFTSREVVLQALVGTCAITLSLTAYAMTTKRDFTMMGSIVFQIVSAMILMSISTYFFRIPLIGGLLYAGSCVLAGFYLIYDIQMICGGKRGEFSTDDYVRAAMTLYMDIIRIFIKLIQILQELKSDDSDKKKNKK